MYQNTPMYPNYGYQYGMAAQQRLSQMEAQYNQPAQNVTWIPVAGIQGAKEHIVQPGNTAWLMDNNEPVFYVKAADNLGVTTLKAYRFQEIEVDAPRPVPEIDHAQYVQRSEFEDLKAQLDKLTNAVQKQPTRADKGAQNG